MNATCDFTIPGHGFDHESLEAARACTLANPPQEPTRLVSTADLTWVEHRAFGGELVAEHDASLPCPLCPPVQGPAPDELVAQAECVEPSCGRTCTYDPRWETFSRDAVVNGCDVEVYCQCEHHDPNSGWYQAAVEWLRAGR